MTPLGGPAEVIGAWRPGWRPATGWCGPWRLDRTTKPPRWIRPSPVAGPRKVLWFTGPPIGPWPPEAQS